LFIKTKNPIRNGKSRTNKLFEYKLRLLKSLIAKKETAVLSLFDKAAVSVKKTA